MMFIKYQTIREVITEFNQKKTAVSIKQQTVRLMITELNQQQKMIFIQYQKNFSE